MATLTVYPQPATGGVTSDARLYREGISEVFSTIRNANGNNVGTADTDTVPVQIQCSTTVDQFATISRGAFSFDTTPLGGAAINSATISFRGTSKANSLSAGIPTFLVAGISMGNKGVPTSSDYQAVLRTAFVTGITYTDFSIVGYNDFALNAAGIAFLQKGGISQFSTQWNWDLDNSFGGTWTAASAQVYVFVNFADLAGTTSDPKLVVNFDPRSFVAKSPLRPAIFTPGIAR